MADVHNEVRLHLVWATWDRLPKLRPDVWNVMEQCVRAAGDPLRCPILAIGGVEDHVHVLVRFATTVTIAQLVQELKGYSSRIINERFPELSFRWQGGYGVFPVGPQALTTVTAYIENQPAHHGNGTLNRHLELENSIGRAGGLESHEPGF
jgi:REP element-mobilizing transposase RayT